MYPVRGQCGVHVGDGEDADREVELPRRSAIGIAAAVEPLVVALAEVEYQGREAAELSDKAMPVHTARPSFRRAAMTDIAIAHDAASGPATPTTTVWTTGTNITMTMLVAISRAAGITAERASNSATGRRGRI